MRVLVATAAIAILVVTTLGPSLAVAEEDAMPSSPYAVSAQVVLRRALDNLNGYGIQSRGRLIVTVPSGREWNYKVEFLREQRGGKAFSVIDVRHHSGNRIVRALTIERPGKSRDGYMFFPALARVRRVSLSQSLDPILGSNLTFEDIAAHSAESFEVVGRTMGDINGEPVHVVRANPLYDAGYDHADFLVAHSDFGVLETRFYRPGDQAAFKVMRAPRSAQRAHGALVVPSRLQFLDRDRQTKTELDFFDQRANPELPDHLLSARVLEMRGPLLPRTQRDRVGEP